MSPEPVITGALAAKVLAPALGASLRSAIPSITSYLAPGDRIRLPRRAALAELAEWVENAVAGAAAADGSVDPPEATRRYLGSAECVTLLEHMFVFRLTGSGLDDDGPLFGELTQGLLMFAPAGEHLRPEFVFDLLRTAVDASLNLSEVGPGSELDDAGGAQAQRSLAGVHLRSIDARLARLDRPAPMSADEVRAKSARYRTSVATVHGKIQPPNFDGAPTVPIDRLYVVPLITDDDEARYSAADLVVSPRRVVLGDPGGGKTTLTKKIAHDLATGALPDRRGDDAMLPIVVVLREYGAYLRGGEGTLAQFVSRTARSRYQVDLTPDEIEWILSTGRAYLIFDGLDELLDTTSRHDVADAIEAFCATYPAVHTLVTSRRIGYMQAPLPADFELLSLDGLDDDRTSQYVTNWFTEVEDSPEIAEQKATAFMTESESSPDIRSNPLMLALMCTIYRTEGYIPRNRPAVYEKCTRMLFDRWDRPRGLLTPFEFEAHVEAAIMDIAYLMYSDPEYTSGITEGELVERAAGFLYEWQYEDVRRARRAAEEFITYCRGRAWVFSDVGLTPDGESLYHFTHRTFLEYFTAGQVAQTHESVEALVETLLPYVRNDEWDVVAQLAVQIKSRQTRRATDAIVRSLVAACAPPGGNAVRVAGFLVRCLNFLVPSPPVVREAAMAVVRTAVVTHAARRGTTANDYSVRDIMQHSDSLAGEVRETFLAASLVELAALMTDGVPTQRETAAGLRWDLGQYLPDLEEDTEHAASRSQAHDLMRAHRGEWYWAAVALFYRAELDAAQLLEDYPAQRLMVETSPFPGSLHGYVSPGGLCVRIAVTESCALTIHPPRHESIAMVTALAAFLRGRGGEPVEAGSAESLSWAVRSIASTADWAREGHSHPPLTDAQLDDCALLFAGALELDLRDRGSYVRELGDLGRLRRYSAYYRARLGQDRGATLGPPQTENQRILDAWAGGDLDLFTASSPIEEP